MIDDAHPYIRSDHEGLNLQRKLGVPLNTVSLHALDELARLSTVRSAMLTYANRYRRDLTPEYYEVMLLAGDVLLQILDKERVAVLRALVNDGIVVNTP